MEPETKALTERDVLPGRRHHLSVWPRTSSKTDWATVCKANEIALEVSASAALSLFGNQNRSKVHCLSRYCLTFVLLDSRLAL